MSRRVVPGAWYAVLGDDVVVVLPPSAKARVAAVWELVDDGAGFDAVLDGLISGGLRELPGFVLLSSTGEDVRLVIRGAGTAELTTSDGPLTVSGDADSTWVERTLGGVTGWCLRVVPDDDLGAAPAAGDAGLGGAAHGDHAAYQLGAGLVRVSSVEQPASDQLVEDAVAAPLVGEPVVEEPVVEEPVDVEPVAGEPVVVPVPGPEELPFAPLPTAEPAPDPAPRPVARLVFSSGDVVDVDRPILVGRAPQPRGPVDEDVLVVPVLSPNQEISATHLEVRPGSGPDEGSAVVTDLGSTNGTLVVQPGQRPEDLQPGIAVALALGAVIDLGEGATIQVTP